MLIFSNQRCINNPQKPSLKAWLFFYYLKKKKIVLRGRMQNSQQLQQSWVFRQSEQSSLWSCSHCWDQLWSSGIQNSSAKKRAVSSPVCLVLCSHFVCESPEILCDAFVVYLYIQHSPVKQKVIYKVLLNLIAVTTP